MEQLANLPFEDNVLSRLLEPLMDLVHVDARGLPLHLDYDALLLFLASFEVRALYRNWERWMPNEYNHQFDHNIGVGNLREVYFVLADFVSILVTLSVAICKTNVRFVPLP